AVHGRGDRALPVARLRRDRALLPEPRPGRALHGARARDVRARSGGREEIRRTGPRWGAAGGAGALPPPTPEARGARQSGMVTSTASEMTTSVAAGPTASPSTP